MNKGRYQENLVFIAHTPYHILLSVALAFAHVVRHSNKVRIYLVIVNDFQDSSLYKKCLDLWENNPFSQILVLPNCKVKQRLLHYILQRKNTLIITKFIKKITPNIIYVFNDLSCEAQVALYTQHQLKFGKSIYVEDGAAPYISYEKVPISKVKLFLKRIVYGNYFINLFNHGTHPQITEMWVNFPELINKKSYSNIKINKINYKLFDIFRNNQFLEMLTKQKGYSLNDFDKISYIVILPFSDSYKMNRKIFYTFKILIKELTKNKIRFAIKYHPREKCYDYYIPIKNKFICEIPKFLPIELLYVLMRNKTEKITIVGLSSTALITAGIFLKNARIYSLCRITGTRPRLINKFRDFGIEDIKSIEQILNFK